LALAGLVVALVVSGVLLPAGAAEPKPPKFLGPLLSKSENPNRTLGRDGGFTVPLPNGKVLWIFADTPRLEWRNGAWRLAAYFGGSSAALMPFTPGKVPAKTTRVTEIAPGKTRPSNANAAPFIPTPTNVYMPNGSGKKCTKANGQPSTNAVRWPIGGVLMPDKTNVLIPYALVCVESMYFYTPQGWGFTRYNWKTNKFSQQPTDVFRPKTDGSLFDRKKMFGEPILKGNKLTFYSWQCCSVDGGIYQTTVPATVAALSKKASYSPQRVTNLPATFGLSVTRKSKTHANFSMYVLTGTKGQYDIYSSPAPTGPWTKTISGTLPRCDTSPHPCHSLILHSELSPAGRLLISYHLPAFGPGDPSKHPYPKEPLRHVVMASVPCNC
jgi:hypothetical protein